jgi:2-polyprenyl-3-methyl-5-hydroxy-6-metoxy-1,4-benzoquinol methylase
VASEQSSTIPLAARWETASAHAKAAVKALVSPSGSAQGAAGFDLRHHSLQNYERYLRMLSGLPRDLAMAKAVGSTDVEDFKTFGDLQVKVLRLHGLVNGMAIYDVGCGSGRTAQALVRSGWKGRYQGHDILRELVDHLKETCPGYQACTHLDLSIPSETNSQDIIFHWSVFTHLLAEECFIYMKDMYRALKPGGKLLFSFLELSEPLHYRIFMQDVDIYEQPDQAIGHINTFLHREWISAWANEIGFRHVDFTSGSDDSHHPCFGQSLVSMIKQES